MNIFRTQKIIVMLLSMLILSGTAIADSDVSREYRIGPGDVLFVSVWREEGMQQEVLVRPDGGITFPLAGHMMIKGKTAEQVTDDLVESLKKYIPNPVVTVSVIKAVSNKVYVVGKVNRPGEYNATHYMDVLQALSVAGGITPYADADDIKIVRRVDGRKEVFAFDYDAAVEGDGLDANIILEAGDTIIVP